MQVFQVLFIMIDFKDGTLGSNIVLSSIPGHVQKSILYRRNHSDVNDVGNSYPHVVYKVSDSQVHQVADLSEC